MADVVTTATGRALTAELMRSIEFLPDHERKRAYYRERKRLIREGKWPFPDKRPIEVRVLDGLDRRNGPVPPHAPELGQCWEWTGARTGDGYGNISVGNQRRYVHRIALEIALGRALRDGMLACHRCENRACGRPSHLYEGTYADNNEDVWVARRRPKSGSALT